MKKVAIVCAAGKEGRLLVQEALSRGCEVTGFVRKESDAVAPAAKKVVKDLFDLTREDLAGFDAGGEEYFVNDKGVSRISYADYAIAMIDEVENANNIQKRFSVIGK